MLDIKVKSAVICLRRHGSPESLPPLLKKILEETLCSLAACVKSAKHHCSAIGETERDNIFKDFW